MATTKFTEGWLKSLAPPETGRLDFRDTVETGLCVRVGVSGKVSWSYVYDNKAGQKRRFSFGTYPATSLKDARARCRVERGRVQTGADPASEKAQHRKEGTFAELAASYIELHARHHKKSWKVDRAVLDRDALPVLGQMKLPDISQADIHRVLDRVEGRGATTQINRTLEIVRRVFSWGIGSGRALIPANPCLHIQKRAEEKPRKRVLTPAEIRSFWEKLETAPISELVRLSLRLQLLTGSRPGEPIGAAKSEFDTEAALWTLPDHRAKNGRSNALPLCPMALDVARQAMNLAGDSEWLFPSPHKRLAKPITSPAVSRAVHKCQEHFGFSEPFTAHDLRRTFITQCREMGADPAHIDRVVNHVEQSVSGRSYDQHRYINEKRLVLAQWENRLSMILAGRVDLAGQVVPLAREQRR
ncbi:MAG: tyrosine-type recombinase/integrase [Alphaproteobacteria bacterium]|nr:tyrosine-type recombinase/integrase [Alphaproteobacteria bacterium]